MSIELWVSTEPYRVSRRSARPCSRAPGACAWRAAASASRFATEPPLVSTPSPSDGSWNSSRSQPSTCSSTATADWSKAPTFEFMAEARKSASTAEGSADPLTQPQKRGWMLP